jgi:hypothetical protein
MDTILSSPSSLATSAADDEEEEGLRAAAGASGEARAEPVAGAAAGDTSGAAAAVHAAATTAAPTDGARAPAAAAAAADLPRAPPRAAVSTRRIYLMCMGDFGLAFAWVLKYAVTTPYFEHTLQGGPVVSHIVWALGPLSGLLSAPVVGVLSDQCTSSFGRRRPYILGGMLASIVGMTVFAAAGRIAFRPVAIPVAVLGFALLDFSSNVIMFPSRALMGDLLAAEQQHDVQSAAAVIASVAEICAGAFVFSLDAPVSQIERLFAIASVIMLVSVSVSLYMCPEKPLILVNRPQASRSRGAVQSNAGQSNSSENNGPQDIEMQSISEPSSHSDGPEPHTGDDDSDEESVTVVFERNPQLNQTPQHTGSIRRHSEYAPVSNPESPRQNVGQDVRNNGPIVNTVVSDPTTTDAEDAIEDAADVNHLLADEERDSPVPEADDNGNVAVSKSEIPSRETRSVRGAALPGQRHPRLLLGSGRSIAEVSSEVKTVVLSAMRNFPRPLFKVGVVYFLAWACWFACLPAYSVWIGQSVLGGNPKAAVGTVEALEYQRGVNVFSLASMFKAVIALAFSAYYPLIVRVVGDIGERVVFGIPFLVFSMALWIVANTKSAFLAGSVVVLGAIPFIATQTIPVAIAVSAFPDNLASNLGILNLFCVSAQLFDTMYTGFVAKSMGEGAVMRVGSVWAFVAGVAAFLLL